MLPRVIPPFRTPPFRRSTIHRFRVSRVNPWTWRSISSIDCVSKSVRWETLASIKGVFPVTLAVWEKIVQIIHSIMGKLHVSDGRTTKQENSEYSVDTSCFDASKVNSSTRYFEVPFLLPLLDFNSKPHNSNLFTILPLSWDHLSVVNRKGNAGRQKLGTSSLATGQPCLILFTYCLFTNCHLIIRRRHQFCCLNWSAQLRVLWLVFS